MELAQNISIQPKDNIMSVSCENYFDGLMKKEKQKPTSSDIVLERKLFSRVLRNGLSFNIRWSWHKTYPFSLKTTYYGLHSSTTT